MSMRITVFTSSPIWNCTLHWAMTTHKVKVAYMFRQKQHRTTILPVWITATAPKRRRTVCLPYMPITTSSSNLSRVALTWQPVTTISTGNQLHRFIAKWTRWERYKRHPKRRMSATCCSPTTAVWIILSIHAICWLRLSAGTPLPVSPKMYVGVLSLR